MGFTVIPRTKSSVSTFTEAFNPFLQLMIKRRMEETAAEKTSKEKLEAETRAETRKISGEERLGERKVAEGEQEFQTNLRRSQQAFPQLFGQQNQLVNTPQGPQIVGTTRPEATGLPPSFQFLTGKAQPGTSFDPTTGKVSVSTQKPVEPKPLALDAESGEDFKQSVSNGVQAVQSQTINPTTGKPYTEQEIFLQISSQFPGQASTLKTIFLSTNPDDALAAMQLIFGR